MEKIFYESKPFLYIAGGTWAGKTAHLAQIGKLSALILLMCGLLILIWRAEHRGFLDFLKTNNRR